MDFVLQIYRIASELYRNAKIASKELHQFNRILLKRLQIHGIEHTQVHTLSLLWSSALAAAPHRPVIWTCHLAAWEPKL